MKLNNKVISIIIVIELIVVVYLWQVIWKKIRLNFSTSIQPLSKTNILFDKKKSLDLYYELKPNNNIVYKANGIWLYEDAISVVNKDGLIELQDYEEHKPPHVFRIVVLGDSFTAGSRVNKNNWTEMLEKKINDSSVCNTPFSRIEVINLAVPGYDIYFELERFKRKGIKYNPDLVLWMLIDNDFNQLNQIMIEREMYYKKKLVESGEYDKEIKKGVFFPESVQAGNDMKIYFEKNKESILRLQKSFLLDIRSIYSKNLVFLSFEFMNSEYSNILNSLKSKGKVYYFSNIVDIYKENASFYPYDSHPNEKGHLLIMNDIFSYLNENNLIPCKQ